MDWLKGIAAGPKYTSRHWERLREAANYNEVSVRFQMRDMEHGAFLIYPSTMLHHTWWYVKKFLQLRCANCGYRHFKLLSPEFNNGTTVCWRGWPLMPHPWLALLHGDD